ncbi:LysR family transcriptional regulator [Roseovarius aestuarii]|uniref:Glycine cleavage system transcriptional activator n=1 Tax=Roseovarius aestuarii TaxID=475083 RepID=A0A1X7BYI6_9RHOB|nr:LysR family transcriptional regulator [Roseovarius aestuarii]SMC14668.1 Glycine cleavage system transcriptional activator [Roseovarius aestuarii]
MNAQKLDWSDVPFVLAVCESGSLSGAARQLGVNHSTVFRRIEGVETRLGVTLFERLSHGYVMTAAGEHFFRNGLQLRDGMNSIERELGGQDLRLEGALTVTTTDSLLHCLAPVFKDFQRKYPDIELRLLSGTRPLDLMQRDADIALRPTSAPPEHWIGRNLSKLAYAAYAQKDYLHIVQDRPTSEHRWIRLNDSLNQSPMSQITLLHKTEGAPVTISSSLMGVFELVRGGLGIGALPCYLGEAYADLVRVHDPEETFDSNLWMLAHPDIRRSARVHAFFEFATVRIREVLSGIC